MSAYVENNLRLKLHCDQVVPLSVLKSKAQDYVDKVDKAMYVPGVGEVTPTVDVKSGTMSVKPGSVPIPDMVNSFNKKQLQELVAVNGLDSAISADVWKLKIELIREAVLEAFRLDGQLG